MWEQTAIISLYSINWLVCITEECVYCAVRTGYLYIILRSAPHNVFIYFVWISEQTAIIFLYSINWLLFITETECVYYAVQTEISLGLWQDNTWTRFEVGPCGTGGGQSDTGTVVQRFPAVGVLSRFSLFIIGHSRHLVGHAMYRSRLIPAHRFRIRSLSVPWSLDAK